MCAVCKVYVIHVSDHLIPMYVIHVSDVCYVSYVCIAVTVYTMFICLVIKQQLCLDLFGNVKGQHRKTSELSIELTGNVASINGKGLSPCH